MKNDSPLYLQKIECPVCKALNEFETIKVGAYEEDGRDSDFRPKDVKWKNPKYQKFTPTLFFMATCANCYFTREYTAKFKDWKNDTAFKEYKLKTLRERHTLHFTEDDSVIKTLGERLDAQEYPLQTAISKLLLGIYDELLLDRSSNLDVARYFIRVAWLFRDAGTSENTAQNVFMGYVSAIEDEIKKVSSLIERFQESQTTLDSAISDHIQDVELANESAVTDLKEKYGEALAQFTGAEERLEFGLKALGEAFDFSNNSFVATGDEDTLSLPYHDAGSYLEFLRSVRSKWEKIPASEADALRSALTYYKASYESGHEVAAGNQQIQVEYLIAEINRRLGRYEDAKKYFNNAVRSAQQFMYQHKGETAKIALAKKIYELALSQGKVNLKEAESAALRSAE